MSIRHPLPSWADARDLASRLRQRITLQQAQETADGAGGSSRSWSDVATVWAELVPYRVSRGDERVLAEQLQAEVTHRVSLRYRSDVTVDMRISYAGRLFNIRSVTNVGEADVLLDLLVEEGVAL